MASIAAARSCLRSAVVVTAAARPTAGLLPALLRAPAARSAPFKLCAARSFSVTSRDAIRKYTKDHEWIDLSADKTTGVIGISEYAAEALGDVVYVELPEEGAEVKQGDAIGAVESVKSAADINAPISCTVTAVNRVLEDKPGTINQVPEDDSHGGGWIARVTVGEQGVADLESLMDAEEYKEFTATEEH